MHPPFLTPEDLAIRWKMAPNTLSQWRWNGRGPQFFKIGRHVLYKIEDVEHFEEGKKRQNTSVTPEWSKFPPASCLQEKRG